MPTDPPASGTATDLARQFADIAAVMLIPGSVAFTEHGIANLAVSLLEDCDEAAVCDHSDEPLGAPSSDLGGELDRLQVLHQEGPCVDALGGVEAIYVPDLAADDVHWPRFSPAAARLGMRSALAYRLSAEGVTVGALQFYGRLPGAFNTYERAQGLIFATYAGTAISLARTKEEDASMRENLNQALESREIIGQAQGILMERERITSDQAFALLRRASQDLNLKLRAIAQQLVDTGRIEG